MMRRSSILSSGIPSRQEYQGLESQPGYKGLLQFSRRFESQCQARGDHSKLYGLKWVEDPFLQWSRRWEYVYVLQRLRRWWIDHPDLVEVVDAGSGFTFFPFYLLELNPQARIQCFDMDVTVGKAIAEVGNAVAVAPSFRLENIERMNQEAESIDIVYSVSVIEHTRNPDQVLNEVHRILKPGGMFLCTFDISFERKSPMHIRHVESLISRLSELFVQEAGWDDVGITAALSTSDVVTTKWISETTPETLPWRHPLLVWLYDALRGRFRPALYRPMTFYCGAFYKKQEHRAGTSDGW